VRGSGGTKEQRPGGGSRRGRGGTREAQTTAKASTSRRVRAGSALDDSMPPHSRGDKYSVEAERCHAGVDGGFRVRRSSAAMRAGSATRQSVLIDKPFANGLHWARRRIRLCTTVRSQWVRAGPNRGIGSDPPRDLGQEASMRHVRDGPAGRGGKLGARGVKGVTQEDNERLGCALGQRACSHTLRRKAMARLTMGLGERRNKGRRGSRRGRGGTREAQTTAKASTSRRVRAWSALDNSMLC